LRNRGSQRTPAEVRKMPVPMLCAKLGEDFELFSDRTEDAVERERLIHDFESILAADIGALDIH
jgi:hypothetical protein